MFCHQENTKELERRSQAAATVNTEPSKTIQGPALEADINWIAKAYGLTGKKLPIPPEIFDPRHYIDQGDAPPDLQSALNLVRDAEHQFMQLPATLRRRFDDSPAVLWDWLQSPENGKEAVTLGLLKEIAPEPPPAPPAPASA